jgi:hypothetical protein
MIPTVVLLGLGVLPRAFRLGDSLSATLGIVSLAVLLWAVPLWLVLVGAIFRSGRRAFGPRAGLGYAALAVVLTVFFGLGVFAVPLMVRADIQRLLGSPPENSDQPQNESEAERGVAF